MRTIQEITVAGKTLAFSNLEKVLYPAVGFTKANVIDYYARVSPVMLPHLKNRAITFKRYPNGVDNAFFYEKNCPSYRPEWMQTVSVWSDKKNANTEYCLLNEQPSLLWAANLAVLELHPSLALKRNVDCPTMIVFDLDPGEGCAIAECCQVALLLQKEFSARSLESFAKTSGSKGLQIYVPLNTPTSFDITKSYAQALAQKFETSHPDRITHLMRKELRKGKIFIDWSQNDAHKTTVSVYSLRAKERPTVSTPVSWEEVEKTARGKAELSFTSDEVLKRVEEMGDLFQPLLTVKQRVS